MRSVLKAVIVDDETNARLSLRGVIEEHFNQIQILGEAKDLPEAVKTIHKHKPDLVFLDIQMPGYSGLSILDFFDNEAVDFKIVFVTAYSDYAMNAFELSAIDYLLKPIRKESLERVLKKLDLQTTEKIQTLKDNLANPNDRKIALQTSEGLMFIKLDDIILLKADGSYTHIYLTDGNKITVSRRLNEYERIESAGRFIRIHRSHIINLNHIVRILKQNGGSVVMSNGEVLSISADKKNQLLHSLNEERF